MAEEEAAPTPKLYQRAHRTLRLNTALLSDASRSAVVGRYRQILATLREALEACVPRAFTEGAWPAPEPIAAQQQAMHAVTARIGKRGRKAGGKPGRRRHASRHRGGEAGAQSRRGQSARDQHDPRPAVRRHLAFQMNRRMQHVVHPLQHDWVRLAL